MNANKAHLFQLLRFPALLVCFLGLAISAAPTYAGGLIFTNSAGTAIDGYDPVAYFTMDKAVPGTKQYKHRWLNVNWHFANAEHRDLFAADPTRYAPQHGGYCSVGAVGGGQYSVNPRAWRIVDNGLYLFYDDATAAGWDPDNPGVSASSDEWLQTLSNIIQ